MELRVIEENGVSAVEGEAGKPFMSTADDINRVIEACFSNGTDAALLYPENLPSGFFDLSSGHAGAILQKMYNYRIRLAIVCSDEQGVRTSSRFGEMLAEERRGRFFGMFETRRAAIEWLA